ncbi:hypothetical protein PPERSA_09963 [Pseudocohnilembus persalinus]|uniref:Uncharacterized protein n=1 Tax=Pseudocohnilembus persalinus TaxID=266149 RepID=A0A0V0QJT8_PSEPJ|nr:hypothetical protein PPERSA_09963 [Pseudocohnilembus persalinus]|eukprot:KRX02346.1 hypothetical protein PPERSA_09963 [Pseudocohnilembus persalinus]
MAFINKGKSLINTQKSIKNYKNAQEANGISSQKNLKGQSIQQLGASEDQEQENKVKKSKINIKYNQEIYPKLDEYDPDDLEKLKQRYLKSKYIIDPFLNLWGTVINTEDVQNIEDFAQIDHEQMTLLVNYLQIFSEIRNQRILFSTIQINKTTADELDFQLFEQNKKHLVKSYNLEPFKFLISLVQQPNDQWFLLISNLKKKESILIDFHRNPKNKTLKDSFDTMVDIYNELYDLNIEYFNMTCLVKNMTEISDSQDTRFYYFIYLYKFITQAKHSQLNVSEYEFETGKDRVLLLILKLKLMINEKLKTVPKPITDLQDQADNESEEHLQDRLEQRNQREEEMNQEENKLLPLIEQYDEDEYQFLLQQHKKAKPIDLKQNFSQHFDIQLSYEDVEILEINEAVTQKMMQFLINYILYQNQKKLMRKLAMAYIKVDDESDEYFSYRLQWPEFLQDQLTPDIDAFQFLFLLMGNIHN